MFKKIKNKLLLWFRKKCNEIFHREMILFKDIKIPKEFKRHYPSKARMQERWDFYNKYKEIKVPIIIDKNNVLVDGYTSYLIAKKIGAIRVSVKRI